MTHAQRAKAIIDDFAQGEMRLTDCLKKHGLQSGDFYSVLTDVPSLAAHYSRAREIRAELMADEVVAIADTEPDVGKAKNRIDARKWIASKLYPRSYGDRLDVNVTERVDVSLAITEAKRRALRPASDLEHIEDAQYVELPALSNVRTADETSVAPVPAVENPFDD